MSTINFSCPHCGHTLKLPTSFLGKKGKCPKCGVVNELIIPAESQPSAPVMPDASQPSAPVMQQPIPPQQTIQQQFPPQQPVPSDPLNGLPQTPTGQPSQLYPQVSGIQQLPPPAENNWMVSELGKSAASPATPENHGHVNPLDLNTTAGRERQRLEHELEAMKHGSANDAVTGMQMGASAMSTATNYNNTMPGAIAAGMHSSDVGRISDSTDAALSAYNAAQRHMEKSVKKKLKREKALLWLSNESKRSPERMTYWGRSYLLMRYFFPTQMLLLFIAFANTVAAFLFVSINTITFYALFQALSSRSEVVGSYKTLRANGVKPLWTYSWSKYLVSFLHLAFISAFIWMFSSLFGDN